MITNKLRKRFCKDYNLPINIFDEPYFMYYINLYDKTFDCVSKYNQFVTLVDKLGGESAFFSYAENVVQKTVNMIKDTKSYKDFNESSMSKYSCDLQFPGGDIYNESNIGKFLISIDLSKANFQALKYVHPAIVNNVDRYESLFTDYDPYFANSKQIRQVIFGNLNPKRQQAVQKHMMGILFNRLISYGWVGAYKPKVLTLTSDELIFDVSHIFQGDGNTSYSSMCHEFSKMDHDLFLAELYNFPFDCRIEKFKLIKGYQTTIYMKDFLTNRGQSTGEKKLKACPINDYAQAYKGFIVGKECEEYDYLAFFDGKIYKAIEPLIK